MRDPNAFLTVLAQEQDKVALQALTSERADRGVVNPNMPWDEGGGFSVVPLSLANLTNEVSIGIPGYEIQLLYPWSTGGALLMVNGVPLMPGQRVSGYAQNYKVRNAVAGDQLGIAGATSGTAVLLIHKIPGLDYRQAFLGASPAPVLLFSDVVNVNNLFGNWTGPNGVYTTFALADTFDVRMYRAVEVTLVNATVLTAGTVSATIIEMDGYNPGTSTGTMEQYTGPALTSGQGTSMLLGEANSVPTVGGSLNVAIGTLAKRIKFFKLGVAGAGGATGLTGGRLFVWGYP